MSWPPGRLLADTSAWARIGEVREARSQAVVEDRLVTVAPVELELLHSARDRREAESLLDELSGLRSLALTAGVLRAARTAVVELAGSGAAGHHRVPATS